jgi:hypothetical protein
MPNCPKKAGNDPDQGIKLPQPKNLSLHSNRLKINGVIAFFQVKWNIVLRQQYIVHKSCLKNDFFDLGISLLKQCCLKPVKCLFLTYRSSSHSALKPLTAKSRFYTEKTNGISR